MMVVVVEDEVDLLDLVTQVLLEEGLQVVGVDHPGAVDVLDHCQPDVFLVDLMLPGTTGFEFAALLRKRGFDTVPMIAMSASNVLLRAAANSDLFIKTLAKPFDVDTLLSTVSAYAS